MSGGEVFFLIGAPRSGTTALAKMLGTADNVRVDVEASPKMCISARLRYLNMLSDPVEYLRSSMADKLRDGMRKEQVYGDKNPNYLYFIKDLFQAYQCKFVFILRDGRDVVRSCMDFNRYRSPTYHRYEDGVEYTLTEPEQDFWDFARLRPRPDDSLPKPWKKFSKFEKYSWSWARFNELLLEAAKELPKESYRFFRMDENAVQNSEKLFHFLELSGFDREKVAQLARASVNTTPTTDKERFPSWPHWQAKHQTAFSEFAGDMMVKLENVWR